MRKTLCNGKVITPFGIHRGGVTLENGKITRVFEGDACETSDEVVDCRGNYISPGFVDLHTHSTISGNTMDATVESLHNMTELHAAHGTTSLLPSTLSQKPEKIARAVDNICKVMRLPPRGARVLGAHLESNYFAPSMAGAQNPEFLFPPEESNYMPLVDTGCVRRISCAPELPGALDMARKLAPKGIQFSMAHSAATPEQVEQAVMAGYTSLTHIYNAETAVSSVFLYPEAGISEMSLLRDEVRVECICDGNHLSPSLLKFIYKIKGADGMFGVTDAVYAGAPDGEYDMAGLDVVVGNNICILKDKTAFAGSVATMDLCVRTLHLKAGICLQDAVAICAYTPAKIIGMHQSIGCLAEGFDADICVFDGGVNILQTIVMGKVCYDVLSAK